MANKNNSLTRVTYDGRECYFLCNNKKYMKKHIDAVSRIMRLTIIQAEGATDCWGNLLPQDYQILVPVDEADQREDVFADFMRTATELADQYRERLRAQGYPVREMFNATRQFIFFGYTEVFRIKDYLPDWEGKEEF